MMPGPLFYTSAILGLVTTAYSSCQKLHSTFNEVRNAPKHIAVISKDLEGFYLVLGTIQALLDEQGFSAGIVQYAQSENLCKVLGDCMLVFKDFETIISDYQAHNNDPAIRTWQRLKWTFKKSAIKDLRNNLSDCKATLNLAISTAHQWVFLTLKDLSHNMHATNQSTARIVKDMAAYRQELEHLPQIQEQMEDLQAAHLPQATPHHAIDRAGIRIDYRYTLRHYVDGTASTYSGIKTPSTPSFQASALGTSNSGLISEYHAASISQISNGERYQPSRKCTQIFVRNVGAHQTMAFQVSPEDTIEAIKSLVRERIGLEHASSELLYSGRSLDPPDKSIDEYGIPHDAKLTCLSFRPSNPPILSCVMIKTLWGKTFRLSVEGRTPISEVKEMSADFLGIKQPRDIRLIHGGKQLEDLDRLSDYSIDDEAILDLVTKYGRPPVVPIDKSRKSQEEDEARLPGSEPENSYNQVRWRWWDPYGRVHVLRRHQGGGYTGASRRGLYEMR